MTLDGLDVNWCEKLKYLGVWIVADKTFNIDLAESRRKFFISLNCILSKTKFACDLVKLKLLENHCLSSLMYCIECGILNDKQLQMINSWWNSAFRKNFGFFKWESVRNLICTLGKINLTYLENLRRLNFIKNLKCATNNLTMSCLTHYYMRTGEFQGLLNKHNIFWSFSKIRLAIFNHFEESCK